MATITEIQTDLAERFLKAIVVTIAQDIRRIDAEGGRDVEGESQYVEAVWPTEAAIVTADAVVAERMPAAVALEPLAIEVLRLSHAQGEHPAATKGYALAPRQFVVDLATAVPGAFEAAIA